MKSLDLSFNKIYDSGAMHLLPLLTNIDYIDLHWCGMSEESVKAISNEMKKINKVINFIFLLYVLASEI